MLLDKLPVATCLIPYIFKHLIYYVSIYTCEHSNKKAVVMIADAISTNVKSQGCPYPVFFHLFFCFNDPKNVIFKE